MKNNSKQNLPVISIIGKTDSGKTTLIEQLIPLFSKKGYIVGTIKHDVHDFQMDHPGKDTWRHTQAGARTVVIASSKKIAMIKQRTSVMSIEDMARDFFPDVDFVITEGYASDSFPKIEVFRPGVHNDPIYKQLGENNLIAFVSDQELDFDVPCFTFNELDKIIMFIEEQLNLKNTETTN